MDFLFNNKVYDSYIQMGIPQKWDILRFYTRLTKSWSGAKYLNYRNHIYPSEKLSSEQ